MKNTNFNGLKNKVSNLERKIPEGTTLIYINLHNAGKQNFEKKYQMLIKNSRCRWFINYNCFKYKNQWLSQKQKQIIPQKLQKLKRKSLIMIMLNILPLNNLIG